MDRRKFLKLGALASATAPAMMASTAQAAGKESAEELVGMLIDTTRCIGCQACEVACAKQNGMPYPEVKPQVAGEDRPTKTDQLTVVNRFDVEEKPVWVKKACNHCNQAACASACLCNAMEKLEHGPVIWHKGRCMGCRYCMIACPFDVPKFEYHKPIPVITKCTLCSERLEEEGGVTACSAACPQGAIQYGTRRELLEEAWRRITTKPDAYHHHIYGRREVGGTEVMYLAAVPFEELGFRNDLGFIAYSEYPKEFLYGVPMLLSIVPMFLYGVSKGIETGKGGDK